MQCLQLTRGEFARTIPVTITGSGSLSKCYALIDGRERYEAGTYEVNRGDTITFGLAGGLRSSTLTIDGTQVLEVIDSSTQTYDWTVSYSISTVEIAMAYNLLKGSTITVTT